MAVNTSAADLASAAGFPIRTVSSVTGVSDLTLRAWERRYGLVQPMRTPGGHRVYSREDIDTIFRVLALLDEGVAIGQVKHSLAAAPSTERADEDPWVACRASLAAAISKFDENQLEDTYNEWLSRYPSDSVIQNALLPLLAQLGETWRTSNTGIAQEHFLAAYLRNKLGAQFHHRKRKESGDKLIVACLPGEHHETGALLFSLAAHNHGFRLVLLGANMPIGELTQTASTSDARAIVLSGSNSFDDDWFTGEFADFVGNAPVPVFLGGPSSLEHYEQIANAGAVPLGCDVTSAVQRIARALQ